MTQLQNFSSVLEVAFAVNGLHYIYSTRPKHDSHLQQQLLAIESLKDKCKEASKTVPSLTGDVSTEWGYQFVMRYKRGFWANATICAGIAAFAALISSAYQPDLVISAWFSIPFMVFLFIAPLRAHTACREIELAIDFYVEYLEKVIRLPAGQDIPAYENPHIPIGVRSHSINAYCDSLAASTEVNTVHSQTSRTTPDLGTKE